MNLYDVTEICFFLQVKNVNFTIIAEQSEQMLSYKSYFPYMDKLNNWIEQKEISQFVKTVSIMQ